MLVHAGVVAIPRANRQIIVSVLSLALPASLTIIWRDVLGTDRERIVLLHPESYQALRRRLSVNELIHNNKSILALSREY